jgi:hypothetical protein
MKSRRQSRFGSNRTLFDGSLPFVPRVSQRTCVLPCAMTVNAVFGISAFVVSSMKTPRSSGRLYRGQTARQTRSRQRRGGISRTRVDGSFPFVPRSSQRNRDQPRFTRANIVSGSSSFVVSSRNTPRHVTSTLFNAETSNTMCSFVVSTSWSTRPSCGGISGSRGAGGLQASMAHRFRGGRLTATGSRAASMGAAIGCTSGASGTASALSLGIVRVGSVTPACERGDTCSPPRTQPAISTNGAANLVLRPTTAISISRTCNRAGSRDCARNFVAREVHIIAPSVHRFVIASAP